MPASSLALARFGDCVALGRLGARVLPGAWDEAAFAHEVQRTDSRVWLARRHTRAWGGAVARSTGCEIELLWLAVDSGARRRGLGSQLVSAVLRWAWECGALVRLEVRVSNGGALRLYARHGFVVVGRRPRYYGDGKDALLLEHPRHREVTP